MKRWSLWAITMASLVGSAMAEGMKGDGKYGAAGCGLGSLAFDDSKGPIQILAATLNGIYYNQTFGMTSGTSNCAEDGVALKDKEQEFFANANFESLHQEIAQGQGENLKAFATLFGCQGRAVETFSRLAHDSYGSIFPSEKTNSAEMLGNVQGLVKTNPELQTSCSEKG
jgi:hypothetical protein